jgi:cytoskeletal protein CcmA (bactofilin family)
VKPKNEPAGDLSGFLDRDTETEGDICFKETLRIDGKFQGRLRGGRTLVVGEAAQVTADVEVGAVFVSGRLEGKIRATERVEFHRTARVSSEVTTPVLVIEEGAWFEGSCAMEAARPGLSSLPKGARPIPLKGA